MKTEKKKKKGIPLLMRIIRLGFQSLGPLFPKRASKIAWELFTTPRKRAKHTAYDDLMAKARVFDILYCNKILKAYEWGSGDKTVLLIHGWESRGTALRSFVPGLVEKGYKVVALDGPAHGNSEGKQTTLTHYAGAISAIATQLGELHSIIAHSFGGGATVLAMSKPNSALPTKNLVLIAMPAIMESALDQFLAAIGASTNVIANFKSLATKKMNVDIEVGNSYKSISKIKTESILLVHDEEDQIVPYSDSLKLSQSYDHVELLTSKGNGHFKLIKKEEIIQPIISFIDRDFKNHLKQHTNERNPSAFV